MYRAQLEIAMRNGQSVVVGFEDDESVNPIVERLKKAMSEENALFPLEMNNLAATPPTTVVHYLPTREIVRFAVVQFPRTQVVVAR
jgi:hypothetical protein